MADEKYELTLEGDQIDDALLQMHLRAPEGWTKGTRDGVPVGSTSEYFENNAEWFAQQAKLAVQEAEDAAARAEAAVPAGTAGAVFFDRAQSLTEDQQEQARANVKAGASNPNLLRNGWFNVNSRGVNGAVAANTYGLDGWISNNANVVMQTGQVSGGVFSQYILADNLVGKTVTVSVIADGDIVSGTITLPSNTYSRVLTNSKVIIDIDTRTGKRIIVAPQSGAIITAVKLELGAYSTLANDTAPDPEEERARCMMSTADSSDGYANVPYGSFIRPNLLDNGWFTVNQRGQSSYTGNGYTVDRWQQYGATTAVNNDGTLTLTYTNTGAGLFQRIPYDASLIGKVLTFSVMFPDGEIFSAPLSMPTSGNVYANAYRNVRLGLSTVSTSYHQFTIYIASNSSAPVIKAVKLELGSYSTLANDALPNFAEELAKCQRYFVRSQGQTNGAWGTGYVYNNVARLLIPTSVPMRTIPTVSIAGGTFAIIADGTVQNIDALSTSTSWVTPPYTSFVALNASVSNISNYIPCVLTANSSNAYIDLSADL